MGGNYWLLSFAIRYLALPLPLRNDRGPGVSLEVLTRNEEVLRALLQGLDQGILIAENDGRVTYANQAVRSLLEIPQERPITTLNDVGGINLKLVIIRGLIDSGFSDAVSRRHEGVVSIERWFDLPSARRCVQLRTAVIERPRADPLRLILMRDITESRRLAAAGDGRTSGHFISRDPQMRDTLRRLAQVAPTDAYVLLQGESGTGKNLLARQLHQASRRATRPLVEVNCAAIPSELLESELFGHVRGAFTGAHADRQGRFAVADRGTLFLDEVGEVPLHLQAKFLQAVQEQRFEPVGSNKTLAVDVRIVSASNRNLKDAVEARQFRADLYYRLSVITLHIPPLRARKADIPLLIDHFLDDLVNRGYPRVVVAPAALRLLLDYPWPGNVRELENALEHAVICAIDGSVEPESLPHDIRDFHLRGTALPLERGTPAAAQQVRGQILFALRHTNGNKAAAAKMLGIDRVTLWRRMRKLGLA